MWNEWFSYEIPSKKGKFKGEIYYLLKTKARAGEPEPVVFGCSEPEPAEKKTRAGAEAAQKKNREPEPLKLGGSGSGSLWLIIKQILKIIFFLMC